MDSRTEAVACKAGALPKEVLGLGDADKVSAGEFESMCNPIGQARLLAEAGTELNVLLGLCVGHDSLFFKHSVAPVTVLAAKDRVLGHNPLAAIYQADGYYHDRLFPAEGKDRQQRVTVAPLTRRPAGVRSSPHETRRR